MTKREGSRVKVDLGQMESSLKRHHLGMRKRQSAEAFCEIYNKRRLAVKAKENINKVKKLTTVASQSYQVGCLSLEV